MVTGLPGAAEVLGLAAQPTIVGAGPGPGPGSPGPPVPGVTVIVVVAVTVPFRFVAVNVYVVVAVGLTERLPLAFTVPRFVMVTVSAFSTFQLNVDELPAVIEVGFAVKLITRGAVPCVT
jgi:hypothetical protein